MLWCLRTQVGICLSTELTTCDLAIWIICNFSGQVLPLAPSLSSASTRSAITPSLDIRQSESFIAIRRHSLSFNYSFHLSHLIICYHHLSSLINPLSLFIPIFFGKLQLHGGSFGPMSHKSEALRKGNGTSWSSWRQNCRNGGLVKRLDQR